MARTITTPGLDFIVVSLAKFGVPSAFLPLLLRSLGKTYNFPIPTFVLALTSLFFIPAYFTIGILYKSYDDKKQAEKLGARLAPQIYGKSIGNMDVLARLKQAADFGYPGDFFSDYIGNDSKDPLINLRVMWTDLVFTAWPEHIKLILATDFDNYIKGERLQHALFSMLGDGVFNSEGEMWKFHRSMTRPFFTRDRTSDFELFDRHTDTVISIIKERMRMGCAIDFQDLMSRFSLDSASEFLFGHCLHSLTAGTPYPHNTPSVQPEVFTRQSILANAFSGAFLKALLTIAGRERFGWIWPLTEILGDRTSASMKIIYAYLDPIVQEALAKKQAADKSEQKDTDPHVEEGETLIDHLLKFTSDPIIIRDETLNILLAGRDTTASTLSIVYYLLSKYPNVLKRLREEVLSRVGPVRRPDYDDIKEMKYLRAVINETLRLFPIVPLNFRECVNATVWPSPDPTQKPIYIPAGTKVPYSVFLMQRRTDLWGPDAEEFDPDRFLDERLKKYMLKNPFIFIPFHAGPRICIGQQFAYNEMSFMLIRLLQQFSHISHEEKATPIQWRPPAEWASAPGRKAIERICPGSHLTMYVRGGVWLKMEAAETAS